MHHLRNRPVLSTLLGLLLLVVGALAARLPPDEPLVNWREDLAPLLTNSRLQQVALDEITWRGMDDPAGVVPPILFPAVNVSVPGILVVDAPNERYKFRLLDGRQRMAVMVQLGMAQSAFYVLERSDIAGFEEEPRRDSVRVTAGGDVQAVGGDIERMVQQMVAPVERAHRHVGQKYPAALRSQSMVIFTHCSLQFFSSS